MKIITIASARAKVQAFRDKFDTHREAAEAAGCTEAQMSHALRGKSPICPALQVAAGIRRATLYVDTTDIPDGYTHN